MEALEVYLKSDGELTTRYYKELEKRGIAGVIALNLFRAQKCSSRAKVYRGRRFKSAAYDRKSWSMANLCSALGTHGTEMGITWGWKQDPNTVFGEEPSWVLYVELSVGQVSFHSPTRGVGPDYPGEFDGCHKSQERILAFCDAIFELSAVATSST